MKIKSVVVLLLLCAGSVNANLADVKLSAALLDGCEFTDVSFKADFETARLHACEALEDGSYLLSTDAENRPINPSPWYAFTVNPNKTQVGKQVARQVAKQVTITIAAIKAKARSLPKRQMPIGRWKSLDFEVTQAGMKFSVELSDTPLKIAGQPIINNSDYDNWTIDFANTGSFEKIEIGKSTQGRPIHALVTQKANNHEWLVLIGRQHPPELTGAMAMLTFASSINNSPQNNNELLNDFYNRFNVLIVPNVNPDGVAIGNWRHNTKGADLNRDWGKFEQLETTVVNAYMESLLLPKLNQQPKLVFALDFHSTQQDIFYTMPNDYSVAPANFADNWLKQVKANTVSSFVVRNRPGTSPGMGVFKQFIADTYNVHAVTYEMGDNTPKALIDHVAQASADELVKLMLATPAADFNYKKPKE
jgi:hypothetical protein